MTNIGTHLISNMLVPFDLLPHGSDLEYLVRPWQHQSGGGHAGPGEAKCRHHWAFWPIQQLEEEEEEEENSGLPQCTSVILDN